MFFVQWAESSRSFGTAVGDWARAPEHARQIEAAVRAGKWSTTEFRRIVYNKRWLRIGEVIQLAPGAAKEHTSSWTVGLSATRVKELSSSLGLHGNVGAAQLAADLSRRITTSVTITGQRSVSETVRLTNDTADRYRRYALWNVEHGIAVDGLASLERQDDFMNRGNDLRWAPRFSESFIASPTAETMTYSEAAI